MNKNIILILCFLGIRLLSLTVSNAQSVIQLSDKIANYNIQDNLEVLPDSLGKLTIEQISSPAYAGKFQKGYDKNIWLANTKLKAHWLKFVVKNESNHNRWLIRIKGNKVTLFDQQVNGSFKTYQVGDMIPLTDWYFKKAFGNDFILPVPIEENQQKVFYAHIETTNIHTLFNPTVTDHNTDQDKTSIFPEINFINQFRKQTSFDFVIIGGLLIMLCYHLIVTFVLRDKVYLYYVLYSFFLLLTFMVWKGTIDVLGLYENPIDEGDKLFPFVILSMHLFYTLFLVKYLDLAKFYPKLNAFIVYYLWIMFAIAILPMAILILMDKPTFEIYGIPLAANNFLLNFLLWFVVISLWNKNPLAKIYLLGDSFFIISFAIAPLAVFLTFFNIILPNPTFYGVAEMVDIGAFFQQIIFAYGLALRIKISTKEKTQAQAETIKIQQETNQQLEIKVQERTQELHETNEELQISLEQINIKNLELDETLKILRATQAQLIQSEKLASLGELTAGIAHEIQNPLNFVNNFAELSVELTEELREEINKPQLDKGLIEELATDLALNQEKINHHGQRASSIVKGMLEHSRTSTGVKEPTDLNALVDEYLRLAYHGLRAKDNSFNATMETHFDPDLPLVSVIPQDIGRVILNLINNAFYVVSEKAKQGIEGFQPTVTVRTKQLEHAIEIRVQDNGNGIPETIKDKIFQPFFTTKPTGQGTGLGLSLAYDIVTKGHGGTLEVSSVPNEGTEFVIRLV